MPTASAVCDKMAMLAKGRIEAQGTMSQLDQAGLGAISRFIAGEEF
jgi:ABC-type transporter Mla maintaining outer membrane lipid asymmetry ATPase subunit MlaF